MPYVASIGTYLPCWGAPQHRLAGDDEDAITLAVEAGRAALIASGAVERVVLVSRDMPLLESSNAAVLLAGLGLDPELEVDERLGGAPATLDAVSSARPRTLIIGTDLNPAVAAAILTGKTVSNGVAEFHRREPPARPLPQSTHFEGTDIPISLAAYERVFEAKTRWEAGRFAENDEPDFSPRYRLAADGSLTTEYELVSQPRTGMTPADVDIAEVHDFFTGIELISYEDLGVAERFGGYKLVEAEVTSVGGALPVNPSGGLKAKGHPPGATGVAQCVELFAQLRGEAANQVDGARVALAHNIGGPTAVSAVTILEGSVNGAG